MIPMEEDAKSWVKSAVGEGPAGRLIATLEQAGCVSVQLLQAATKEDLELAGVPRFEISAIIKKQGTADPGPTENKAQKFVELLRAGTHISDPQERVLKRVFGKFILQYHEAVDRKDSEAAWELYELAKGMWGTDTVVKAAQDGLQVNGVLNDEYPLICTAVCEDKVRVVKILPSHTSHLQSSRQAERRAVERLQPADGESWFPYLVPCQEVKIQVGLEAVSVSQLTAGVDHVALLMPRYSTTLAGLPQLSDNVILAGGKRIKAALDFVHGKQLIHLDVKAANIFIDGEDASNWLLGDYGSSQEKDEGAKVVSTTPGLHPDYPIMHSDATEKYDWAMLLVTLAVELDKCAGLSALCPESEEEKRREEERARQPEQRPEQRREQRRGQERKPEQVSSVLVIKRCMQAKSAALLTFLKQLAGLAQLDWAQS